MLWPFSGFFGVFGGFGGWGGGGVRFEDFSKSEVDLFFSPVITPIPGVTRSAA